jgi:hypothetical protein
VAQYDHFVLLSREIEKASRRLPKDRLVPLLELSMTSPTSSVTRWPPNAVADSWVDASRTLRYLATDLGKMVLSDPVSTNPMYVAQPAGPISVTGISGRRRIKMSPESGSAAKHDV